MAYEAPGPPKWIDSAMRSGAIEFYPSLIPSRDQVVVERIENCANLAGRRTGLNIALRGFSAPLFDGH